MEYAASLTRSPSRRTMVAPLVALFLVLARDRRLRPHRQRRHGHDRTKVIVVEQPARTPPNPGKNEAVDGRRDLESSAAAGIPAKDEAATAAAISQHPAASSCVAPRRARPARRRPAAQRPPEPNRSDPHGPANFLHYSRRRPQPSGTTPNRRPAPAGRLCLFRLLRDRATGPAVTSCRPRAATDGLPAPSGPAGGQRAALRRDHATDLVAVLDDEVDLDVEAIMPLVAIPSSCRSDGCRAGAPVTSQSRSISRIRRADLDRRLDDRLVAGAGPLGGVAELLQEHLADPARQQVAEQAGGERARPSRTTSPSAFRSSTVAGRAGGPAASRPERARGRRPVPCRAADTLQEGAPVGTLVTPEVTAEGLDPHVVADPVAGDRSAPSSSRSRRSRARPGSDIGLSTNT